MSDVKSLSLCQHETCNNKKSAENAYCKLHQLCILVDEVTASGKKLCVNYIRGCRVSLELDHKFTRCPDCLLKDRTKDKERRDAAKLAATSVAESTNTVITEKTCTTCCQVYPIESFAGVKGVTTKTCVKCREDNKKQDSKRDKEHRNAVARVNEAKPECRAVKKQWKEANYEKVAETWMNSRQNRIERIGVDEYAKQNTIQAKNWRDANPEKVAVNNEEKKNNINYHYSNYQRTADLKNLEFCISFDDFCVLVRKPCHYCGELQERGFNGIDRKDQSVGYIMTNAVSCCSVCNYMKNTLSDYVFIKRIEHILSYNKLIDGELSWDLFTDTKKASISVYKNSAYKRGLDFMLLEDDFMEIKSKNCYICDKPTTDKHQNGIDRYNNSIGYTKENSRACCSSCNYMKKDHTYEFMMEKLKQIYRHRSNILEPIQENDDNIVGLLVDINTTENIVMVIDEFTDTNQDLYETQPTENAVVNTNEVVQRQHCVRTNKKTKEEVTENARLRKQKQRESLKEKYGDEEYKKRHAAEIAKNRAAKKAAEQK